MTNQKPLSAPNKKSMTTEVKIKPYFTSFPCHPQCLNFRANIGISDTNSHELRHTSARSTKTM